jgi:hypothetical protein
MHIARYLVQAWDVRNTCKHSGAVLLMMMMMMEQCSLFLLLQWGAGSMALMVT